MKKTIYTLIALLMGSIAAHAAVIVSDDYDTSGNFRTGNGTAALDPNAVDPLDASNLVLSVSDLSSGFPSVFSPGFNVDLATSGAQPGLNFTATVDYLIPSDTVFAANDSIALQAIWNDGADFANAVTISTTPQFNALGNDRDVWKTITFSGTIPLTDGNSDPITHVRLRLQFQDAGNDSAGSGIIGYIDNVSLTATEPPPPPVTANIVSDDYDTSGNFRTGNGTAALDPNAVDPLDAGNQVLSVSDLSSGFPSVFSPGFNVALATSGAQPGSNFTATVDYLIPSDTVFAANDSIALQTYWNDGTVDGQAVTISTTPQFNPLGNDRDVWKTITFSGTIPLTDANGDPITHVRLRLQFQDKDNDSAGSGIIGYIDNVSLTAPLPILTPYDVWAADNGLTAGVNDDPADNPDGDALDNFGEYVFGGKPTDGGDIGIQPGFVADGGYTYTVRNDADLTVSILTRESLVTGNWATNSAAPISADDGGLSAYTNAVGTGGSRQFYKLLVE